MKKIILFNIVFFSVICLSFSNDLAKVESPIPAQDSIIGYFQLEKLNTPPFKYWFEHEYETYTVDSETLLQIDEGKISTITITIVIGTWCSDSQRETPRFIKILNEIDFDFEKITAIGVNKKKKAAETTIDELSIEYVPTIIFYNDGEEIGRIIETPEESLEKDMLRIISSQ